MGMMRNGWKKSGGRELLSWGVGNFSSSSTDEQLSQQHARDGLLHLEVERDLSLSPPLPDIMEFDSSAALEHCTRFNNDGYCVCEGAFERESIDLIREAAVSNYEEVQARIKDYNLSFGIGIKHGFKEIVQRHPMRFEMPYRMNEEVFDFVLKSERIREVVSRILECDDFIVANRSLVVSLPGCGDQGWHSDGPHMSATKDLPCHCLNVFIPLVDVNMKNGPTEFRPGSHYYTRNLAKSLLLAKVKKTLRPVDSPSISRGSVLMFDYRVLHRGLANASDEIRPILVFTFAKPWYKDVLNFPHRSVLDEVGADEASGQDKGEPDQDDQDDGVKIDRT